MDASDHRAVTRREFARQSEGFERPGSLFGDCEILDWIAGHVPVGAGDRVLDVAGGTGQVGRRLARSGAGAVIVDLTEEMLQAGLRAVEQEGRGDVTFVRGDAADLPFPAGHFDVVVSRFALHHIEDPAAAVREMARVCTPGGGVTVIDMVAGGGEHDRLERLRDPSHARALTAEELERLLAGAGRRATRSAERVQTMDLERWLAQSRTPEAEREQIRRALLEELDGGPASGLGPTRRGEELRIAQRWLLLGS